MNVPAGGRSDELNENPYAAPKASIGEGETSSGGEGSKGVGRRASTGAPAPFHLQCGCGRLVGVRASQAGMNVTCDCGAEIAVPSLSKLRELSGIDPYESGTMDTIRRMIKRGELPAGDVCAFSGEPTQDVLDLLVTVPRGILDRGGIAIQVMVAMLVSPLFLLLSRRYDTVHSEESERKICTPLRISAGSQAKVRGASQRKLKRLLRSVPIYAKLLEQYRVVIVSVLDRDPSADG